MRTVESIRTEIKSLKFKKRVLWGLQKDLEAYEKRVKISTPLQVIKTRVDGLRARVKILTEELKEAKINEKTI